MKKQMLMVALAFAVSAHVVTAQPAKAGPRPRPAAAAAGPAQADRRPDPGRAVGLARAGALPLQGDAARRRDVGEDLRPLLQVARQREAVLHPGRHRPVRAGAHQARRRDQQRRPDAAVPDLSTSTSSASTTAWPMRASCCKGKFDFTADETLQIDREKAPWAEERGRGARPVAQARQERLAAPEAGRQGRQGASARPSTSATRATRTASRS